MQQHEQKSMFDEDPEVPEKYAKSEENFETLQLTVECHSMNKNQSLKKIRPVVP